jgi:hypothetical protein
MLLTYPEIDVYPDRGPSLYYGITDTGEGTATPAWPIGRGARAFVYLYGDYQHLDRLAVALCAQDMPSVLFARRLPRELKHRYAGSVVHFSDSPLSVSRMVPDADMVICHGSHQMTAQALLAGKPLLMLPTQLEQFLIMRRVVRYGAALGIAPETPEPDFRFALAVLAQNGSYRDQARQFALRYSSHDRSAALATMIARCESAIESR